MSIQIDQSGKIEDTSKATVLAASNSQKYSVLLPAKEKRRLQEHFRLIGSPRLFIDYIFSMLLYYLILHTTSTSFTVDTEYSGHTEIIEDLLTHITEKEVQVTWKQIGKGSSAHDLAYKTLVGKLKPNSIVNAAQIWSVITKKAGGRLNTGLSPANRRSAPARKDMLAEKLKKSRRRK